MAEPAEDPLAVRLELALSNAKRVRNDAGVVVRSIAKIRDEYQQAQSEEDTASGTDSRQ